MQIFDCHVHSTYSFDANATIEEQCRRAQDIGLCGITITDHSDYPLKGYQKMEHIAASVKEANQKKEKLHGSLMVLAGVEVGDPLTYGKEDYKEVYKIKGLDCILGSIHSKPIFDMYFQDNPYGYDIGKSAQTADMDFLKRFIEIYYKEVRRLSECVDVDIVTHLTFPLRYINGQARRGLDITEFYDYIDAIFEKIIETGKTLEVNTSTCDQWGEPMPNCDLLKRYYLLGGRKISLGSDAHKSEQLAKGIPSAIELLKNIGFTHASYFVNRERREYQL